MKNFICEKGHQFDTPLTQGEEWSESDVCPKCFTDNFVVNGKEFSSDIDDSEEDNS